MLGQVQSQFCRLTCWFIESIYLIEIIFLKLDCNALRYYDKLIQFVSFLQQFNVFLKIHGELLSVMICDKGGGGV